MELYYKKKLKIIGPCNVYLELCVVFFLQKGGVSYDKSGKNRQIYSDLAKGEKEDDTGAVCGKAGSK